MSQLHRAAAPVCSTATREFASQYIADKLAAMLLAELNRAKLETLVTLMDAPNAGSLAGSLFESAMHTEWTRSVNKVFTLEAREGAGTLIKPHAYTVVDYNLDWEATPGQVMKTGRVLRNFLFVVPIRVCGCLVVLSSSVHGCTPLCRGILQTEGTQFPVCRCVDPDRAHVAGGQEHDNLPHDAIHHRPESWVYMTALPLL